MFDLQVFFNYCYTVLLLFYSEQQTNVKLVYSILLCDFNQYEVIKNYCELFKYLPLPLEADVEVEGTGACGSGREAGVTLPIVMADRHGGGCDTLMTSD